MRRKFRKLKLAKVPIPDWGNSNHSPSRNTSTVHKNGSWDLCTHRWIFRILLRNRFHRPIFDSTPHSRSIQRNNIFRIPGSQGCVDRTLQVFKERMAAKS